jgi:hypothetical protein
VGETFGEPEVSDLPCAIFEENISWLEVSMDDVLLCEIATSCGKLMRDGSPLEIIFLFCILFKTASFAIFHNNIAMIVAVENIDKLYNILMVKFLQ